MEYTTHKTVQLDLGQFGLVHFLSVDDEHEKKMLLKYFIDYLFPKLNLNHMDVYTYILGEAFKDFAQIPSFRNLTIEELNYIKKHLITVAKTAEENTIFINTFRVNYKISEQDLPDESINELYNFLKAFEL